MTDGAAIHRDAFWLFCDKEIGSGIGRTTYASLVLPDSVIKIEPNARSFQNIVEWETWNAVYGTEYEKWFAPCEHISANGSVLVMAKTTPIPKGMYPTKMPVFLTDFKEANYGMYEGRIVCHDYGTNALNVYGLTKKMKKVEWWT
jgi:hypothetical protein